MSDLLASIVVASLFNRLVAGPAESENLMVEQLAATTRRPTRSHRRRIRNDTLSRICIK